MDLTPTLVCVPKAGKEDTVNLVCRIYSFVVLHSNLQFFPLFCAIEFKVNCGVLCLFEAS